MKRYLRSFFSATCFCAIFLTAISLSAQINGQTNGLLREVFLNIGGGTIGDLQSHPGWPNNPDYADLMTNGFVSFTDAMENYGQRVRGFIAPPQTGDYIFWISSDDNSILYLSPDETPESKRDIAWVSGWTEPMQWDKESNQQSKVIRLETNKVYYIEALMAEGNGGDNLAVRWQLPDGTIDQPISNIFLYPYGTAFAPPEIALNPTNATVVEGGTATFVVVAKTTNPAKYQWQKDLVNIPDATNATLVLSAVSLADDSTRYRCVLSNTKGSVFSQEALLIVTPDITPPTIFSVNNVGTTNINVLFSEAVQAASATNTSNYKLDQGRLVLDAVLGADLRTVTLRVSALTYGETYTLTVNNVYDRAYMPNSIAANTKVSFVSMGYAPVDIGGPAQPGSITRLETNSFNISGGGTNIDGTADQFFFAYAMRTGDFDVQVRIQGFDSADPWAKAGLMARENLEPGSRYAATLATPGMSGCFFQSRAIRNGATTSQGSFPVNYPYTWLRLQRIGNIFTGFASLDGQLWAQLGMISNALPANLYFGVALSSHSPDYVAAIQVRDLGTVSGGTVGTPVFAGEPLGPSSRQTGLAISEIHYHPSPRADGKNLEFVEIYNSNPFFEDISGHRLTGSIEYTFPEGTVLSGGAFLVVAQFPDSLRSVYGITNVMGPFTGALENTSGTVRLRNPAGAVLLEANYSGEPPWPAAADGTGHSLVLARPSYGERNAKAWAASEVKGGSPGMVEAVRPNPYSAVVINEFLAHTDDPELDFVELYNHSDQAVDLSGCYLSDSRNTNKFLIPSGTVLAAGGFVSFTQTELGFALDAAGETIYLTNPDQTRVIDAVRFGPQPLGVSSGRCADGSLHIRQLAAKTPGAPNSAPFRPDIIISEIMYHPLSGDGNDEYIELYNRGTQAMNLGGWRFINGITFEFPANTHIPAGGYLVIAKNAAQLLSRYAQLNATNTVGDYSGNLSNQGERVTLAKPEDLVSTNGSRVIVTTRVYVVVNEVAYATGGQWSKWADGGGSSLELKDLRTDNQLADNWAESIETNKAPWSIVQMTGVLDNGMTSFSLNNVQLLAQGPGEYLVDNVEVSESGSGNLILNSNFEIGTNGWVWQGNHYLSSLATSGGYGGGKCLYVRAQDRGDTGLNHIYCNFPIGGLATNDTVTLRARVRWLKGWPEFSLRLRGNWLEAAGPLTVPTSLGSPGAKNSCAVNNTGPAIYEVIHSPILPGEGQSAIVTARVDDPDGLLVFNVYYRTDPSNIRRQVPMRDDGTDGDLVAGDGLYTATIPAQTNGALVAFYLQATDATFAAPTTRFPNEAPTKECLVRWGEPQPVGNLGVYHIWVTQKVQTEWAAGGGALNNFFRDATFVYGNSRVVYNFWIHDKGSPWHGGSGDFYAKFPDDDLMLGESAMILASPGNGDNDDWFQHEQHAFWIIRELHAPTLYRRFVHLYRNGTHYRRIIEDSQEPDRTYVRAWFPDDSEGDFYKIDDWFEFNDNATSFGSRDATLQKFTTTDGNLKLARYRWSWRKRSVQDSANNYTNLFNLVYALDPQGTNYVAEVNKHTDMDEWLRIFAVQHIVGNWDSYGHRRGKNSYAYKPVYGKWAVIPFDIDFVLGLGSDGYTTPFFTANDPTITNVYNTPEFKRTFYRALYDAAYGPLLPEQSGPILDARYEGLVANGLTVKAPAAIKTWIANRRAYILSQLTNVNANFAYTGPGGTNFSTDRSLVTLVGTAPVGIKTIAVNGTAYGLAWPTVTNWVMSVPLASGVNQLVLQGLDSWGQPYSNATVALSITYTGAPEYPQDKLVINEIMYNPIDSAAEFVEIYNTSLLTTFDMSQWRLRGVDYNFPEGTLIKPQQFILLVRDPVAFANNYGPNDAVLGQYAGRLAGEGEKLTLVIPGATTTEDVIIDEVTYNDKLPWPLEADGLGSSLQLIDPTQDNQRVGNWAAASTNDLVRFTPGTTNSVYATIPAIPLLWLNEVQPVNLTGPVDGNGDHGPWVELFNSGSSPISLKDWFLTGTYTNLGQWAFPNNAEIQPGQFLLVWVDGQDNLTSGAEWHASFRLNPTNGTIALSRVQNQSLAVMDYLNYKLVGPDQSYGAYPDGQPHGRELFTYSTPGESNILFVAEFQISYTQPLPHLLTLEWPAVPGQVYEVQYSTNLGPSTWTASGSITALTNTASTTKIIEPDPMRIYRIKLGN